MADPKTKFLVVDDFSTMRRIVRNLLKELGYANVDEAEDGAMALSKLKNENFDFVISDWNMPNKSGIEFLQQLRKDGVDTVFGFVTTEVSQEMRQLAADSGASFLIGKPFTPEDFQRALEKYIH